MPLIIFAIILIYCLGGWLTLKVFTKLSNWDRDSAWIVFTFWWFAISLLAIHSLIENVIKDKR